MRKRILIGLLGAISLVALSWTDVGAQCRRWCASPPCGGSNVCLIPSTKGMLIVTEFDKTDCSAYGDGETSDCQSNSRAQSDLNVVFCQQNSPPPGVSPQIVKRDCDQLVFFDGPGATECADPHKNETGRGHLTGKHGCKLTEILLADPADCQDRCPVGFTAVDIVPVAPLLTTELTAFQFSGESGFPTNDQECSPDNPECTYTLDCSIKRAKIEFGAVKPYKCEIIDVSEGHGGD